MAVEVQPPRSLRGHGRLLAGIYVGIATGVVAIASFDVIVVRIQEAFTLTIDDMTALVLTVSAGSLLVLFAAGALIDRVGPMIIFRAGVATTIAGAAMVALAGGFSWLLAGRAVGGIGGTAMALAALAILNESFAGDRERAQLFGIMAAVIGAAAALSPVISSSITEHLSWRSVPLLWIGVAAVAAMLLRESPGPIALQSGHRELVTPLAVGAALSAICMAALLLRHSRATALIAMGVAALSVVVFVTAWRGLRARGIEPTFDISVFKSPGAIALLLAMLAVGSVNLDYYNSLFIQYRIGLSTARTTQLFIAPQVAGIIGGLAGGWISARIGSLRTTALALGWGCMAALAYLSVTEESTAWHVVALLSAFTFGSGCLIGTLTKAFMDCAAPESSGAAAAYRQAAFRVGATLAGVVTSGIALSHFSSNWQRILQEAGVSADVAHWVAESVRNGAATANIVADPTVSEIPGREAIKNLVGLAAAQVDGLKWIATMSAGFYALGLVLVFIAIWRQRRCGIG